MFATSRCPTPLAILVWTALTIQASAAGAQPAGPPRLEITASPGLESIAARLRAHDAARVRGVMRIVGLRDGGDPIQVHVVADSDPVARATPPWIVGFAVPVNDIVVLLPDRTPAYPDGSLEEVLDHEVAHILIYRASGGRQVPRWFDEGLAMTAEHVWGLEDRVRAAVEQLRGSRLRLRDLEPLFHSNERDAARAYALSGAFVRFLFDRYGPRVGARILHELALGTSFGHAFLLATGHPLVSAEASFWDRHAIWSRWVPFLTSSVALWIVITLLALLAIYRQRARSAARRRQWDALEAEPDELEQDPSRWIH